MIRAARGFTLVELIMVMVIIGIMAVVAIPRMDTGAYHAAEFHDKTIAALRFAQKTATSHRRVVCVSFPDDHTLDLTIDSDKNGVCETPLSLPGTTNNRLLSSDPVSAFFNAQPGSLNFLADGTSADANFTAGNEVVTVVGATGYVQ